MSHTLPRNDGQPAKKSFGEIMFDGAVYGGIGYLGNAALSLAISHHAINLPDSWLGQQGQKSHEYLQEFMKHISDNPEQVKRWATRANDVLFLGSGGWLLLVPMKWVEDNKLALVNRIDDIFHTGPQTPSEKAAHAAQIESAPHQSYLSLFGGRAITYPLIIGAAVKTMHQFDADVHLNNLLEKHAMPIFEKFENPKNLISLTSQEAILAGTGAVMLYGFSKMIAFSEHHLKGGQPEKDSPKPQVAEIAHIGQAASQPKAGISYQNG